MADEISLNPIQDAKPIDDIVDIMTYLKNGKVLRVKQDNQGDILVRMSPGKHKFTEVSRDLDKESFYYKRHWVLYNVSVNSLITFDVYLDEEYSETTKVKYPKDTIVEYTREDQEKDVAMIKEILTDNNGNYFYALTGETMLFDENKLNKIKD